MVYRSRILQKPGAGGSQVNSTTSTEGNYAGDNTANRVIPHGLGAVPTMVVIVNNSGNNYNIIKGRAAIIGTDTTQAVTAMTATNFYVGNATSYAQSANANGANYYWIVIG